MMSEQAALLERALGYALGAARLVTMERMADATPCAQWDLRQLLVHTEDSLAAIHEGLVGEVSLTPVTVPGALSPDLVTELQTTGHTTRPCAKSIFRDRAASVLEALVRANDVFTTIGGCPLPISLLLSAGAVEVALHGWDIGSACGLHEPIPHRLASDLLDIVPLVIADEDRPVRFAGAIQVCGCSGPSERLLAYAGRSPHGP